MLLTRHRTTVVVFGTIIWAVTFALVDGYVSPREKYAFSLASEALALFDLVHVLLLYTLAIGAMYLLFRRKFFAALPLIFGACALYIASYAAAGLRGDRFVFTAVVHRQIVDIYNNRPTEFQVAGQTPYLFSLGDRCDPPAPDVCGCWVLVDRSHSNETKREIGGWHRPAAIIFSHISIPINLAIVDVKAINADAYSILGCSMDLRSLIP